MTNQPQLRDALHLGGGRPVLVLLAALLAAAAAIPFVTGAPTDAASRQVLFTAPLAGTDRSPAQVEDFADEVLLAARLPAVSAQVRERTGLALGTDYTRSVERTVSDSALTIEAVAADEATARVAAQTVAQEAVRFVLDQQTTRATALSVQLQSTLTEIRAEKSELEAQAGGVQPTAAESRLAQLLFDASRGDEEAGDVADLQAELNEIEPLAERYELLLQQESQVAGELAGAAADLSAAESAREALQSEAVLSEVYTQRLSAVPIAVQQMLLFAAGGAAAAFVLFILFDAVTGRGKPEPARVVASGDGPMPRGRRNAPASAGAPSDMAGAASRRDGEPREVDVRADDDGTTDDWLAHRADHDDDGWDEDDDWDDETDVRADDENENRADDESDEIDLRPSGPPPRLAGRSKGKR